MRSECSTAAVPTGGNGAVRWGLPTTPPELALCPHGPPGMNTWWNANAGAAIMTNINAETNATAKALFTLLNGTSFPWRAGLVSPAVLRKRVSIMRYKT
jgi:hypothetical protein